MGFLLSKSMDANLKKQQEFMLHNSRLQMERQMEMQNQMRERQMAMQVAWSREFLKYFGTFFLVASTGLTLGAMKRKTPAMLAPIFPLSFILAYQMDNAYGTLIHRMRVLGHLGVLTQSHHIPLFSHKGSLTSIFAGRPRASWRQNASVWAFLMGLQPSTA
ncbi:plasminogen receptor (KT) isoform X1 [Dunckerocampus dactyliophorus]|uniref:plasminogen receptor (KT) isoform X1 n=1 Tax=Dunckerocampus dactyliophorus TaxID=161453 RepID=UPI0024065009|nr:plasminogen receptor (KT) isoform X1 [Dunckerocampus dactyliophorus]